MLYLKIIVFCVIVIFISYKVQKRKNNTKDVPVRRSKDVVNRETHSRNSIHDDYTNYNYENNTAITKFRIAGVTFKDGKYSRQAALRKLSGKVPPMNEPINFEFVEYDYEGNPAVLIKANGRILGNVPADLVNEFINLYHSCNGLKIKYEILGGFDVSYGCELKITWRL